jgi:hypothetical protein
VSPAPPPHRPARADARQLFPAPGGPICRAEACLWFGNLPPGATKSALAAACRAAGAPGVAEVYLLDVAGRDQGAVVFASCKDAAQAYQQLAGSSMAGRTLAVHFCPALPAHSPAKALSRPSQYVWCAGAAPGYVERLVRALDEAGAARPAHVVPVEGRAPGYILDMRSAAAAAAAEQLLQARFGARPPPGGAAATGTPAAPPPAPALPPHMQQTPGGRRAPPGAPPQQNGRAGHDFPPPGPHPQQPQQQQPQQQHGTPYGGPPGGSSGTAARGLPPGHTPTTGMPLPPPPGSAYQTPRVPGQQQHPQPQRYPDSALRSTQQGYQQRLQQHGGDTPAAAPGRAPQPPLWRGAMQRSGQYQCAAVCLPCEASPPPPAGGAAEPAGWPPALNMTSRSPYELLAQLYQQLAPGERYVRLLRPAGEGQAAAFAAFVEYLVQRRRAGVVALPDGPGGGRRTLYLAPPVAEVLQLLQLRGGPPDALYAVVVPGR